MSNLTPEQEAELLAVYDEREAAIKECAPEVAQKLGYADEGEAQFFLLLPCLAFGQDQLLPFPLHPEAIRRFARDLVADTPQAQAVRVARELQHQATQKLGVVYQEQHAIMARRIGLDQDQVAQNLASHTARIQKAHEQTQATKTFRLALADQVLAGDQLCQALQQWAALHWPEQRKTVAEGQFRFINLPDSAFIPARRSAQQTSQSGELAEILSLLPNNKADRDLQRSLMVYPNDWFVNEHLANRYHDGREGHTVVYQPSEVELALGDAPQRALDALDRRFNQIKSEIVADVIDILFHHWNAHKDTQVGAVPINAAKLCEYRGKTLSGDNLELHWHALRDAFSLTLRDTKSDINAKVFNFDSKGENQDGPGARYAYRPGIFLEYALRGEPLYFAPFLQKVWALDPIRHNEAKRLARYLRADWRMNTEKYLTAETGGARAARWHSWAFLLAESGIDVESHRKSKDPSRLIKTMARAVETLYQMEIVAEGGFDIYHPDDRRLAQNLPRYNALDAWLALRVCLAPSAKLREALLETDGRRRAGRARDAKALATERAKKQIRSQKLKQPGQSATRPRKRKE